MYEPRTYRHWVGARDLVSFTVQVKETDLLIRASRDLRSEALAATRRHRSTLESYIAQNPHFGVTLEPMSVDEGAPPIAREMARAAQLAGVGPMAAVAGAIAERVGKDLLSLCEEVIVENGGDVFMRTAVERTVGIYAGESSLTGKIALVIRPEETPLGVCTSSGTVGHSLSFGKADAVVAISPSTALADAAATAMGNRVVSTSDIHKALAFGQTIRGLTGAAIIKGDHMGVWGQVTLADAEAGLS